VPQSVVDETRERLECEHSIGPLAPNSVEYNNVDLKNAVDNVDIDNVVINNVVVQITTKIWAGRTGTSATYTWIYACPLVECQDCRSLA
jgi:hypothetical protein